MPLQQTIPVRERHQIVEHLKSGQWTSWGACERHGIQLIRRWLPLRYQGQRQRRRCLRASARVPPEPHSMSRRARSRNR